MPSKAFLLITLVLAGKEIFGVECHPFARFSDAFKDGKVDGACMYCNRNQGQRDAIQNDLDFAGRCWRNLNLSFPLQKSYSQME
jgi:hypothetical protein